MRKLLLVLKIVMENPINRANRIAALLRFFRWQVGSWMVPGKVLVPWINGSRIFAGFMMPGSAGCAYSGLQEFEEMAFVLHFLRKEDFFLDVGANVGVFTVLAGKAIGAECVSIEPGEEAFAHLMDNIAINEMHGRVHAVNACVSNENGTCRFAIAAETTWNHVAGEGERGDFREVQAWKIDTLLAGRVPSMIKIDVEGFEKAALEGSAATLANPALKAVLLEIGSHSLRYGVESSEIHALMLSHGFVPFSYDPFTRNLLKLDFHSKESNTFYIRDRTVVDERVRSSPPFEVFGRTI